MKYPVYRKHSFSRHHEVVKIVCLRQEANRTEIYKIVVCCTISLKSQTLFYNIYSWFALQTVNMSKTAQYKFSPLFGVRKILLLLRWALGFPLKAKDCAFNEFSFHSWVEFARYFLYICIAFLSMAYQFFVIMKGEHTNNPLLASQKFWHSIGLSPLDILVVNGMPYINIISSMFYLKSFKNSVIGINKICQRLTHLNTELCHLLGNTNYLNETKCKRSVKLLTLCLLYTSDAADE